MTIRYLTSGESHGKALVGIIEGIPAGLEITIEYIHSQLKRRKLGFGRGYRQNIESDEVEILTGVRHGKTLGSPIALLIWNKDWENWKEIMQSAPYKGEIKRKVVVPRPGHADLVGGLKYNHSDMRNVLERASARETTMRVALASVCRKLLEDIGVQIASRVISIGSVKDYKSTSIPISKINSKVDNSLLRCLDKIAEKKMISLVKRAQKSGNTLGGCFEVYASGVPIGLGSYVQWDRRLDGIIAKQMMSLNAIKGVEVGLGFETARLNGSEVHDELFPASRKKVKYCTNRSGGIDGGITTGQTLVVRAAMKPLATLMRPLFSVDLHTGHKKTAHVERSDICAVPAAAVIGESLLALVITESLLDKFGGDSMKELNPRLQKWNKIIGSKIKQSK